MNVKTVFLDLPPESFASLEELSILRGTSLAASMADAIAESLMRERLEFGCFKTTQYYDGLIPDGSIRLTPAKEYA